MIAMPQYKNPISLIPGGCPQFLDYEADLSILDNVKYNFEEAREKDSSGRNKILLHAFRKNEEGEFADEMDETRIYREDGYLVNGLKAIQPWLGKWLPLPFLRCREQTWPDSEDCRFEYGPSNWARGRLAVNPESPSKLRLTIAFDMQVEQKNPDNYAALTYDDVDANAHFKLAWRFRDNSWYMNLGWVEEWLREAWQEWLKANKRRPSEEWQFEYLAYYLTYQEVINLISNKCEVYVVRPDGKSCVNVDIILDIGNSRTTGILVETHTQSATNLNDSYLLQLRDMSAPENIYTDPFETRIEFSECTFGNDALSMRSGRRTPAFVWPSPVRIGPEAGRLSTLSRCEKGSTGMSSPKRYLWDERDWKRTWRFNTTTENAPYVTRGPLAQQINSSGTPLCCMQDKLFLKSKILKEQERESAFESLFTRSSLMMFLLIEIIQQALLTINSPGQRLRRDLPAMPRHLRQIIFTVPAGMPVAEQRIYYRWAVWAVHALWEALGWGHFYVDNPRRSIHGDFYDYRISPIVRCDWDEATCTQLVFIYNEITRKFQGDAMLFCELAGRKRLVDGVERPTVRVATIDIGGGTTDLSITTFELASGSGATPRMVPHPDFHDGFNLAGDDILRAIISEHVLWALGNAMSKAGVPNIDTALATLFGRDTMDSSKDTLNKRIQFIRQIAVPVALVLLALYEKTDISKGDTSISLRFGDCFYKEEDSKTVTKTPVAQDKKSHLSGKIPLFPQPSANALSYISDYVAQFSSDSQFDVLNTQISLNAKKIDTTVRNTLKGVLSNLCEVINLYDCDALLLTGRPSKWPGIINTIYSMLPLPPSRIYPMAQYQVGPWYPFSDALGNMTDPKTTVVVGAILCALAEGQLEGFSFDSHSLTLTSTARFIGEMELDGQIKKDKVWFHVDPEKREVAPEEAEITFSGPLAVGFRQLDVERWTTTRFYFLDFVDDASRTMNAKNLPFKVQLKLNLPESQDADSDRDEGEFEIGEITGRDGEAPRGKPLEIRLQTLPRNEGFWMDTGIIYEG